MTTEITTDFNTMLRAAIYAIVGEALAPLEARIAALETPPMPLNKLNEKELAAAVENLDARCSEMLNRIASIDAELKDGDELFATTESAVENWVDENLMRKVNRDPEIEEWVKTIVEDKVGDAIDSKLENYDFSQVLKDALSGEDFNITFG